MNKRSAGILMFRGRGRGLHLLLVHPGGPFWAKKDEGAWSIPKGEYAAESEDALAAARREFAEEIGTPTPEVEQLDVGPAASVAATGTASATTRATIGRRRQRARSIAPAWQVQPGGWRHYAAPPSGPPVPAVASTESPRRSATMQKPLGPYTPIVRAGDWLIVSGQVGAKDGQLADGVAGQTALSIENVAAQLATMGATLDDVKKTLCFLVDMADFATFNEAYVAGFGDSRPARSTIAVAGLPIGAQVEIEAWAYKPE